MPHSNHPFVRVLSRLTAAHRHRVLRRQWQALQDPLASYADPTRRALAAHLHYEASQAAICPLPPQFYASSPIALYAPWGDTAHRAFQSAMSADLNIAIQGIALWLVTVNGELAQATHPGLQVLHAEIEPLYTALHALHERALAIRRTHERA